MPDVHDQLDAALATARQRDPSLDTKAGRLLLRACFDIVDERPDVTAPEIAREVLGRYRHADASWVAHLATAAIAVKHPGGR